MPPFLPQNRLVAPAALDFSPLGEAIDGNRRNALLQGQQDIQREDLGMRQRQFDQNQQTATIQRLGRRAQAIDALPPGDPRRAAGWQAILKEHPGAASLDPSWLDPVQGPKMLVAETGEWMDPMKRQLLQAQIAQAQAGVANIPLQRDLLQANIARAKQKDVRAEMEAGLLSDLFPGISAPAGSAPPAAPGAAVPQAGPGGAALQPMSGTSETVDPMLIQAQAAPAPQTAPPSLADRLTPAQRQALGLALIGRGDAGKILMDADGANKLNKEALNRVEGQMLDAVNQIGRLDEISKSYKDRFQTLEGKVGNRVNAWLDYSELTRKNMNPKDRQELAEFTAFRRDAFENLNRYIKEVTGAQMSEAEAQRLVRAMPNPGTGLWDGDSPTEFRAKMDGVIRQTKLAYARMSYLRKNGFAGGADEAARQLPLERMQGVIQKRTDEIAREAIKASPGATPQDVAPLVRQRLRAEFGIGA